MKKLVTILTVGMMVVMTGCSTQEEVKPKTEQEPAKEVVVKEPKYDWSDSELASTIPFPETDKTSIEEDIDNMFWVYVNGDKDSFVSYIEDCKDKGFDIDIREIEGETYSAYNKDGVYLSLNLDGTQFELTLKESMIKDEIVWPSTGMSSLIKNPNKSLGTVVVDSSDQFVAYVGEVTEEEFKTYMDDCISKGFKYDFNKGGKYFNGRNGDGDYLHLKYEGVNTMYISMMSAELIDDGWESPAN